ncbi:hypothetical protein PIB19_06430 [Sphingomonas sp. 7/4-4]|uniref:hypothetical protein n=1 Tax=Sphingomonas sp. 7/4-4 TaxID=3018446 RepID=UPI0022F39706|nr:hypothetical protein [Sphingomonas sp. 7/4-4]WBY09989.1 hypothetical protein PIB19_06430 [Sphingomonas sp. 7/4-4]
MRRLAGPFFANQLHAQAPERKKPPCGPLEKSSACMAALPIHPDRQLPIDAPPVPDPGSGSYVSFGRPCPIGAMMLISRGLVQVRILHCSK